MAGLICCDSFDLSEDCCPLHGNSMRGWTRSKTLPNEQNVKPKENKASYRQHSFVEYAEIPEVTYTHRPLVG